MNNTFPVDSIFELSEVRLKLNGCYTVCSVIYRPPLYDQENINMFFSSLESYLNYKVKGSRQMLVTGDFNIYPKKHEKDFDTFKDIVSSYGLSILLHEPTRITDCSESCLDNFLTNIIGKTTVIEPFISDHMAVVFEVPLADNNMRHSIVGEGRNLSERNTSEFKVRLGMETWTDFYNSSSVNAKYDKFVDTIRHHLEIACPIKKFKNNKSKKVEWLTDDIKKQKVDLLKLYSNWTSTKDEAKRQEYINQKRIYRNNILKTKSKFVKEQIQNSKNPNKTSWNFINKSRGKTSKNIRKISPY